MSIETSLEAVATIKRDLVAWSEQSRLMECELNDLKGQRDTFFYRMAARDDRVVELEAVVAKQRKQLNCGYMHSARGFCEKCGWVLQATK